MATTAAALAERIDASLKEIAAEAAFLPDLAAGWQNEDHVNRDVWYLEWRELMGRLAGLHRKYRACYMNPHQREHYRALRRLLRDRLPILHALDLPLPPVSLDD